MYLFIYLFIIYIPENQSFVHGKLVALAIIITSPSLNVSTALCFDNKRMLNLAYMFMNSSTIVVTPLFI